MWTVVAIPAPPAQAQYYTAATVMLARRWIATLAVTGAVVGVLARQVRTRMGKREDKRNKRPW